MLIPFFSPGEMLKTLHFCFLQNGQPLIPTMDTTPAHASLTAVCMRHMSYLQADTNWEMPSTEHQSG